MVQITAWIFFPCDLNAQQNSTNANACVHRNTFMICRTYSIFVMQMFPHSAFLGDCIETIFLHLHLATAPSQLHGLIVYCLNAAFIWLVSFYLCRLESVNRKHLQHFHANSHLCRKQKPGLPLQMHSATRNTWGKYIYSVVFLYLLAIE